MHLHDPAPASCVPQDNGCVRVTWWLYTRHGVPCVAIGKPHPENVVSGRKRAPAYQFAVAAFYDALHEAILVAYRLATGAAPRPHGQPALFSCKSFVPWTSVGQDGYGEEEHPKHACTQVGRDASPAGDHAVSYSGHARQDSSTPVHPAPPPQDGRTHTCTPRRACHCSALAYAVRMPAKASTAQGALLPA